MVAVTWSQCGIDLPLCRTGAGFAQVELDKVFIDPIDTDEAAISAAEVDVVTDVNEQSAGNPQTLFKRRCMTGERLRPGQHRWIGMDRIQHRHCTGKMLLGRTADPACHVIQDALR